MERILLVEPDYQNKYPPIGLMKIATFHKERGDLVEFYKGDAPYTLVSQMNRVYITTLFTFHYDITLKCIKHYMKYISKDNIYIGGIAATLLTKRFEEDTGIRNIMCGLLTDSCILGYTDGINVDLLPLDYDILDDISYKYPAGDNYFVHTTRGCPRGCSFCAVSKLEPKFETTNNVTIQVQRVDAIYGEKKNLLVMDNNILCSPKLNQIINDIRCLGFTGEKNYIYPNPFISSMQKIRRRINGGLKYSKQLEELTNYLDSFSTRIKRYEKAYKDYIELISNISREKPWDDLIKYEKELSACIEKYRSKAKMIKYVDFNQGIDARLINKDNAKILATIPIKPFRLAYDSLSETEVFIKSTTIAVEHGIKEFSNYMLFNFKDKPEDLWLRLHNAINLYNSFEQKITAFSFPMKYAPIDESDRSFIGENWNKKYLGAINIIINVTKGVVAKELDFFYEAFGENIDEYFEILNMPDEMIRSRHYFRDNGLLEEWKTLYRKLSDEERKSLLNLLCASKVNRSVLYQEQTNNIKQIFILYTLNKSQFDRGEKTAESVMKDIKQYD